MIKEQIKELETLTTYLKEKDKEVITKAIIFSEKAHKNQIRKFKYKCS